MVVDNLRAPLVGVFLKNLLKFLANHHAQSLGGAKNFQQCRDLTQHRAVVVHQLRLLHRSEAIQTHIENGLRLALGQVVRAIAETKCCTQTIRPARISARPRQQRQHVLRLPTLTHQRLTRLCRTLGCLDQFDHRIDVGQCNRLTFQQVRSVASLPQQKCCAPRDHLATMREKCLDQLLQIQRARLAADQRNNVDAIHNLQLRLGIQIVEDHLARFATPRFDDDAHAVLVGFVAQLGNAFDALFLHQLRDLLNQARLVDLIRNFTDDDGFTPCLLIDKHFRTTTHEDSSASRAIRMHDASTAADDAAGREIWPANELHQIIDRQAWRIQQREAGVEHFLDVVRRNVRRHTDCNAGGAVDQQIGQPRRQHIRHFQFFVVVRRKIDCFFIEIRKQFRGDTRHPNFGVPHRGRWIAVDGAEISLAIDEGITQGELLGHAHDGVVGGGVAVGVVLPDHIADHPRRLHIGAVKSVIQFAHCE